MPTAPGSAGIWYATFLMVEHDALVQVVARKLAGKGELNGVNDQPGRPVGMTDSTVLTYAVAKYALLPPSDREDERANGKPVKPNGREVGKRG